MLVKCPTRDDRIKDEIMVYSVSEYTTQKEYTVLSKTKQKKKIEYLAEFGTFDIETTSVTYTKVENGIEKEKPLFAFMYVWSACINGVEIYGRTWQEFLNLLAKLKQSFALGNDRYFVIYVHNLPFEFSFLQGYISDFSDVFATGERKPLVWRIPSMGIEFRDSYKLSNMSLEKFTQKMSGCRHVKANGDLDYKLYRHSETPITETEWGYIINDTLGLWESIKYMMEKDGDKITTIPLTSTSYVRRDVKRATGKTVAFAQLKKRLALDEQMYSELKQAFRGGDTHANKATAGIIWHDVFSVDASSMYPAQQLLFKFPMTKFSKENYYTGLIEELIKRKKAWFAHVRLYNVTMKDDQYNPYLAIAKCTNCKGVDNDNGRVWSAKQIDTYVTDIDWEIINECYDFSYKVFPDSLYSAYYDYLPKCFTDVIMEYFKAKTELKAIAKMYPVGSPELEEAEYNLMKAKNKLNGIYGMSATDPVHDIEFFILNDSYFDEGWHTLDVDRYSEDEEYRQNCDRINKTPNDRTIEDLTAKAVLPYQWGVWTTALARKHLRRVLKIVGSDYLYCDTDSCKAQAIDEVLLNELNDEIYKLCEARHAYVDLDGKRHYIGFFDNESKLVADGLQPEYKDFITLGAKKYCVNKYGATTDIVEFECTISGVRKKNGAKYLNNDITAFKVGKTIKDSGGFNIAYLDSDVVTHRQIVDYTGKVGTAEYTGYSCMMHREYTIGITDKQMSDYKIIDMFTE